MADSAARTRRSRASRREKGPPPPHWAGRGPLVDNHQCEIVERWSRRWSAPDVV